MILYPPNRFDLNEWFIICSLAIVSITVFLLPKRFTVPLTIFVLLFNVFLGQTIDFLMGAPPYDLYDTADSSKYEIMDSVLYLFTYPLEAYIFLTIYDWWRWKGIRRILYIGGWSLLTLGLEWLAVLANVYTYKGWHLVYSFITYLGVFSLNILALLIAEYLLSRKMHA